MTILQASLHRIDTTTQIPSKASSNQASDRNITFLSERFLRVHNYGINVSRTINAYKTMLHTFRKLVNIAMTLMVKLMAMS